MARWSMKGETSTWLGYAGENLAVARLSLGQNYLNACLQNTQQCIEKSLKALVIEKDLAFRKTHNIQELAGQLAEAGLKTGITEDECDLIDAIYLPSKYPMSNVLPEAKASTDVCRQCLDIAERVVGVVRDCLDKTGD